MHESDAGGRPIAATPLTSRAPWRIGVDIVARSRRDSPWTVPSSWRVLQPAERQWIVNGPDPAERALICVSARESLIKALGGRPELWSWSDVAVEAGAVVGRSRIDAFLGALAGLATSGRVGRGTLVLHPAARTLARTCIEDGDETQAVVGWVCSDAWLATVVVVEPRVHDDARSRADRYSSCNQASG